MIVSEDTPPNPNQNITSIEESTGPRGESGGAMARGARSVGVYRGEMGALGRGNDSTRLHDRDLRARDNYVSEGRRKGMESR